MTTFFDIKEASFENLENCASIAILGKRRTGKTTWAKYILQFLKHKIQRFVAICGNKENASEWKRIIHPLYVIPKNIEYLKRLRDYQDNKVSTFTDENQDIPSKYYICIIIDDCGCDRSFMHHSIMKDILSNGRHYGITIILLCQYLNQMHAENRDQLDYIGLLHTSNQRNIHKLHEEYVNIVDRRTFKYVLNACTSEKGMCWIDNTRTPSELSDVLYFKTLNHDIEIDKIGGEDIRQYGNNHYLNDTSLHTKKTSYIECDEIHKGSVLNVDTDTDISDNDCENKSLLQSIPPHLVPHEKYYTDKKGTITIRTHPYKQKVE